MKRELTGYAVRSDDTGVTFLASSPHKALDGWSIPTEAWDTAYFDRIGAPLMYGHDYQRPPIGKVTKLERTKAGLVAHTEWDMQDPFAAEILRKIKSEFLNCCSVGFDIVETKDDVISRASLIELSVVPIPSDSHAVVMARSAFEKDEPFESHTAVLEDDAPDPENPPAREAKPASDPAPERLSWDETATAMVRLNMPYNQRSDEDREREWKRLKREYDRHKQQAPEFVTNTQLEAWGPDELRGLFLAGEPEMFPDIFAWFDVRAGAALNARNRKDIEQAATLTNQAATLINGVLERSAKAATDDESNDEAARAESALAKKLAETFGVQIDE